MLFARPPKNRRFNYRPRFIKSEGDKRISFKRKTSYQPHAARNPLFYFALAIAFFLIYLYLTGGNLPTKPDKITVTSEDAVQVEQNITPDSP